MTQKEMLEKGLKNPQDFAKQSQASTATETVVNENYYAPYYPYHPAPCPGCGRCPYCGRPAYSGPYYPSYPQIWCRT